MRHVLTGAMVVGAVHALTFLMVTFLPNAAVIALGILGGNPASVENYWKARDAATYPEQLLRLARGDLGATLDGSPVLADLHAAVLQTAPALILATAVAISISALVLKSAPHARHRLGSVLDTASLLPPFIFPFLVAPLLFATAYAGSAAMARVALIVSVAIPLTIMISAMLLRFFDDAMDEAYNSKLALNGVPSGEIRRLGRLSAYVRLFGLSDRIIVAGIVSLLLAEPLLGLPGIGALYARGIKTADPNLTVAISTAIAVAVVGSGVLSAWVKSAFEAYSSSR